MAKQLRTAVHLQTPDGTVVYAAGDTPPAKHAKLITNPKCWEQNEQLADDGEQPES